MKIKPDAFFKGYRTKFGVLTQDLVDALNSLIDAINNDPSFGDSPTDRQWLAYCLATFKWETAHTFRPIDEHGGDAYFERRYGPATRVGKQLGNIDPGDGARFHGRGFVQLTGRLNYDKAGKALGIDLIADPDGAKQTDVAYRIATIGMRNGWFTGKKLKDYIKPGQLPDYENARRIINGLDKAHEIANIASHMDDVLQAST